MNWKEGFYISFKVSKNSVKMLDEVVRDLTDDLNEMFYSENSKKAEDYNLWKDIVININEKKFHIQIIFGNKNIHFTVIRYSNKKKILDVLDKYSEWIKSK